MGLDRANNVALSLVTLLLLCSAPWGCQVEATAGDEAICEEAAAHRAQCTGEYITPPPCDEQAARQAEQMLEASCQEIEGALGGEGKADGAFCDWFGVSCNENVDIFRGPACERDSDCAANSHCTEGQCFPGVSSAEFSATLDQHTESREVSEDHTELLADNEEALARRLDLIRGAEHSVHVSALYVDEGAASRQIIEAFADATARGVEVRVVVDAVSQDQFGEWSILRDIVGAGADTLVFNPITGWATTRLDVPRLTINNRLHEKMLIADGREAIVGGRNTSPNYLGRGNWFDVDVYVRGPGVGEIQGMFADLWDKVGAWERESGCPGARDDGLYCPAEGESLRADATQFPDLAPAGNARTRAIYSEPYTQDPSYGYLTYNSLIRGAEDSITIAAAFFIPPRRLRDHLRAAAQRGVDVRILKNSEQSAEHTFTYWASLNFYRELIEAGVEIREHQGSHMLHAKTMVVDGEVAVVGSYNLSPRSAESNSEALMLIKDDDTVRDLQAALERALSAAERASADLSRTELLRARAHRTVEWLL